jgi:hypothetical protein
MRMIEKIERFFLLDEEERTILKKAGSILYDMGEAIDSSGRVSLFYAKFTEPIEKIRNYDEGNFYDLSDLLTVLSKKERIDIE